MIQNVMIIYENKLHHFNTCVFVFLFLSAVVFMFETVLATIHNIV